MLQHYFDGVLLLFIVLVLTIFAVIHWGNPVEESTAPPIFIDHSNCKNLKERPPQKTIWGDVGTGYDCLD